MRKLRELQVTHHRVAREFFLGRLSERDLGLLAEIAERAMPGVATSPVWAATEEHGGRSGPAPSQGGRQRAS